MVRGTFAILKLLALVMPLRIKPDIEIQGLDVAEHGEEAYGEALVFTEQTPIGAAVKVSRSPHHKAIT